MKKLFWVSIGIAALAAFFASSHPDGLEKTAEQLGFLAKGAAWRSLMAGYSVPFISNQMFSTAFAGVAGILIIFCGCVGITRLMRKE